MTTQTVQLKLVKQREIEYCPLEFLYSYIHSETTGLNSDYLILGVAKIGNTEANCFLLVNRNNHFIGNTSSLTEAENLAAKKGLRPIPQKSLISQEQLDTYWFCWSNINTDCQFLSFVALLYPLTHDSQLEVINYQLEKSKG